MKYKKKLYT